MIHFIFYFFFLHIFIYIYLTIGCAALAQWWKVVKNQPDKSFNGYLNTCHKHNHSSSCYNVAKMYFKGEGIEQNDSKAENYLDKACKLGNPMACHGLAHWWILSTKNNTNQSKLYSIIYVYTVYIYIYISLCLYTLLS